MTLEVDKQTLGLRFPQRWLDEHPLTVADLERERLELAEIGLTLAVRGRAGPAL